MALHVLLDQACTAAVDEKASEVPAPLDADGERVVPASEWLADVASQLAQLVSG